MKKIRLKIKSKDRVLAAQLDLHNEFSPRYFCVFAHCFTCTKDLKSMNFLNKTLTDKRFAILRFDFTGLGDSTGNFSKCTFENNIEDIISVSEYLEQNFEAPCLFIGHSLGGAAVIKAAQLVTSVKAVVTIGTPYFPDHLVNMIQNSKKEFEKHGKAEVIISGRNFTICEDFYHDINEEMIKLNIKTLKKPILVMHSPSDETVSINHAEKIFETANHPKSFISLDKADHLLLNQNVANYAARMISEWSSKYL